jgi:putative hydrolase of the HAD superfamily
MEMLTPMPERPIAQTLFIDADDTLWENNILFEAVIGEYVRLLERRDIDAATATAALIEIERRRTKAHGYGIDNFTRALREACVQLLGDDHRHETGALETLGRDIRRTRIQLLPGVIETLRDVGGRHRVILLTKGDLDDQLDKLQRSGLGRYFHRVDVVREKDAAAYADALDRHGVRPDDAWMVGNSPRSDILPALAAGLGAVYVPHQATWVLEIDALPDPATPRFISLPRFSDLGELF